MPLRRPTRSPPRAFLTHWIRGHAPPTRFIVYLAATDHHSARTTAWRHSASITTWCSGGCVTALNSDGLTLCSGGDDRAYVRLGCGASRLRREPLSSAGSRAPPRL